MRHCAAAAFRNLLQRKLPDIVPQLKHLRDHVNSASPLLHYTLALLHPAEVREHRKELLASSKERLLELGYTDLAGNIPTGPEGLQLGFAALRRMAAGDFELPVSKGTQLAARAGVTS